MPSAESLALTNAIRHAADARSSNYHGSSSGGYKIESLMELPSIEYELNLTYKFIKSDDKDFEALLLANYRKVFVLNTESIKSEVCLAPELIYKERKVIRTTWYCDGRQFFKEDGGHYYEEYCPIKLNDNSSYMIESYAYGSKRHVGFYDDNTFETRPYGDDNSIFISKSKESIKKLVDEIFSTAKFKHQSIKDIQYQSLIKWIYF